MKKLNQIIMEFDYEKNFKEFDFYVSKSNFEPYLLINKWPKWEKNFLNISGEKFSGKSHLVNIFIKKFDGIKVSANELDNNFLLKLKSFKNIILEDLREKNIDERIFYSLLNIVENEKKYLITTSNLPIFNLRFDLDDLNSRAKNFIVTSIKNPDDDLIFAIILKNLSDRQILIDKKLIDYIIKRIDRTYGKISDFIYKIDQISLKEKKPIDFKLIKQVLE
tara:strand:+ start:35 stop:697 length:663 start_codon:yes stop_codon:yes gene_type:complete